MLTLDGTATATADFEVCSAEFCQFASGTDKALYQLWGSGANDAWAVGSFGTILHWDGGSWTAKVSSRGNHLRAVWGQASQVWVAGAAGVILFHK